MLGVSSLDVSLGQRKILRSISFEAEKGQFIGLIGPNGAGKSTLLKTLCGLIQPDTGEIDLLGKELNEHNSKDRSKHIAYLPQERDIEWPINVSSVVGLGRQSQLGFGRKLGPDDYKNIQQAIDTLGIDHLKDRPANALSGGEKACVLMARALAQNPKILLADEPVAGLDPAHGLSLMASLRKMTSQGMTVIVVMHDLTLAGQFCDQLICLNKGKMISMGSPDKVLNPRILKQVYGIKTVTATYKDTSLCVPVEKI